VSLSRDWKRRHNFRAGAERNGRTIFLPNLTVKIAAYEVASHYIALAISVDSRWRTGGASAALIFVLFVREMKSDECHPKTLSELPPSETEQAKRDARVSASVWHGGVTVEPNLDPNLVVSNDLP
jgi:hypothetical protein